MERIFHNHEKWEDHKNGMYSNSYVRDEKVQKSKELLTDLKLLFMNMSSVSSLWVNCSEHNLSNISCNRRAWLGWASCCYNHGATDEETRTAWNMLTKEEKEAANDVAEFVIKTWEFINAGGCCAKDFFRQKRNGGCKRKNRNNVQRIQKSIFELLRW